MTHTQLLRSSLLLAVVVGLVGCLENAEKKKRAAAAASSGRALAANSGTGTVEGVVIMEGDPAAVQSDLPSRISKDCSDASKMYGLLFREGPGRTVADAFVGVTGYQGSVPPRQGAVPVTARGCSWDKRTYGMNVGQHLAVKSADERPYVPALFGTKSPASLVAVPGGEAVPVYSKGPGMYVLVDEMRNFIQATVLVVQFPTFDVTGLDGRFRIDNVPVGNAKVSAFLPTANASVEQSVTITKNATTKVQLKLRFDAAAYAARAATDAAAKGDASTPPVANAAPSASPSAMVPTGTTKGAAPPPTRPVPSSN